MRRNGVFEGFSFPVKRALIEAELISRDYEEEDLKSKKPIWLIGCSCTCGNVSEPLKLKLSVLRSNKLEREWDNRCFPFINIFLSVFFLQIKLQSLFKLFTFILVKF